MDNIIFSKIDETNIEGCFSLNQDNVPEVGSTVSYTHLTLPTIYSV